jgi:hypothetical protein
MDTIEDMKQWLCRWCDFHNASYPIVSDSFWWRLHLDWQCLFIQSGSLCNVSKTISFDIHLESIFTTNEQRISPSIIFLGCLNHEPPSQKSVIFSETRRKDHEMERSLSYSEDDRQRFQLKAINYSLWTSWISRGSLIIPLKMGQTNPEKNAHRYSWKINYDDRIRIAICWSWKRSASDSNAILKCSTGTRN